MAGSIPHLFLLLLYSIYILLFATSISLGSSFADSFLRESIRNKRDLSEGSQDSNELPIEPRIVGGHAARKGEIGWQARLELHAGIHSYQLCGGSMINYCNLIFIVTAAHCVEDYINKSIVMVKPEKTDIIVNDLNQDLYEEGEWWYKAAEIVQHPDWDTRYTLNDIALIRLHKHIFENKDHYSISLPGLNWEDPEFCTASGWGGKIWNGPPNDFLQVVELPILEWHKCKKIPHVYPDFLGPKEFCVHNHLVGESHGTCDGDSGGPCAAYNFTEQKWYLAGIISYGIDRICGNWKTASVFTRVTNYVDWIKGYAQGWLEKYGTGDPFNNQTKCV